MGLSASSGHEPQFGLRPMKDLGQIKLCTGGQPVAMAEMQTYVDGIPENKGVPAMIIRLIGGEDVDPGELYRALIGEARECVAGSSAAFEVTNTVAERLRRAFPTLTA